MNLFQKRKLNKEAKATIHHAMHVVNMRGDLLGEDTVIILKEHTIRLSDSLKTRDFEQTQKATKTLSECIEKQMAKCPYRGGAFRENFEIIVVAVAVAMGLRAYFIQPFKIPTGSMQPTLYGITSDSNYTPGLIDKLPFKVFKFVVTGDWYAVRRASATGRLGEGQFSNADPSSVIYHIGGRKHNIPKDAVITANWNRSPEFFPSRIIHKGDIIWAGVIRTGDHLFVNKVIWNLRKPHRDEVMVFETDGIESLEPGTHYIKRMCGLPGEQISIEPPYLMINGERVTDLPGISSVTSAVNGYSGYQLPAELRSAEWPRQLHKNEYFAMGDNTGNSRDSRYWGPVPASNLVGPAVFVYWPLSKRWGIIR